MQEILIESVLQIVTKFIIMLLTLAGTWAAMKLSETQKFKALSAAVTEATDMAQQTVSALQQTLVDGWKAAAPDGKLTDEQIALLNQKLLEITKSKMSDAAIKLIIGANKDLDAIIQDAGEAWLRRIKGDDEPLAGLAA
jgi:hypothetical protein